MNPSRKTHSILECALNPGKATDSNRTRAVSVGDRTSTPDLWRHKHEERITSVRLKVKQNQLSAVFG